MVIHCLPLFSGLGGKAIGFQLRSSCYVPVQFHFWVILVENQLMGGRKYDFLKKCQRGRLVSGFWPVGILVMFTEIFVSAFFCGPQCKVLGRQQLCDRFKN